MHSKISSLSFFYNENPYHILNSIIRESSLEYTMSLGISIYVQMFEVILHITL